jgi:hypothetical protein
MSFGCVNQASRRFVFSRHISGDGSHVVRPAVLIPSRPVVSGPRRSLPVLFRRTDHTPRGEMSGDRRSTRLERRAGRNRHRAPAERRHVRGRRRNFRPRTSELVASYCDDWKTNGNETSTEPPAGAGNRQRATSALMQLATSASPSVSCSTSTPETVPACVIVQ